LKEERVMLLEKWMEVDKNHKKEISAMMPKKSREDVKWILELWKMLKKERASKVGGRSL
jgi:hypothetical protein